MLTSAKKDSVPTTQKSCAVYEFSCRCEARYVGRTTQRLADRIEQHVPTSIREKSSTIREQPSRMCKNITSKINCESAIGQYLLTNPECAKTYTEDNFRIIGQARSSFHLDVLESVYIKTQNPVLCRQKELVCIYKETQNSNFSACNSKAISDFVTYACQDNDQELTRGILFLT